MPKILVNLFRQKRKRTSGADMDLPAGRQVREQFRKMASLNQGVISMSLGR